MAREKFQTLTEPMFYTLLCLRRECCGADIAAQVNALTHGRVSIGPGTLYNLLDSFLQAEMIRETKVEGRKRSYLITPRGREALEAEYRRLLTLTEDYRAFTGLSAPAENGLPAASPDAGPSPLPAPSSKAAHQPRTREEDPS